MPVLHLWSILQAAQSRLVQAILPLLNLVVAKFIKPVMVLLLLAH